MSGQSSTPTSVILSTDIASSFSVQGSTITLSLAQDIGDLFGLLNSLGSLSSFVINRVEHDNYSSITKALNNTNLKVRLDACPNISINNLHMDS